MGRPRRGRSVDIRGRCRGAVLWAGALFLAAQVAVNAAVDRRCPEIRDPKYGPWYAWKLARLRSRPAPDRPLALMLGSSLTAAAFRADQFGDRLGIDAFNFGVPGAGSVTQALYWRYLSDAGVRPDLLLVELCPLMLREPEQELPLYAPGARMEDLRALWRYTGRPDLLASWARQRVLPCYSLRFGLLDRLTAEGPPAPPASDPLFACIDSSGWVPWPAAYPPDVRRQVLHGWRDAAERVKPGCFTAFRASPGPLRAIDDLLRRCQRDRAPAALVLMPQDSTFRGWSPPDEEPQIQGLLAAWQRRYGVPVIDARTWVPDEGVSDAAHLLPAGADLFTDRLAGEVARLLPAGGRRPAG